MVIQQPSFKDDMGLGSTDSETSMAGPPTLKDRGSDMASPSFDGPSARAAHFIPCLLPLLEPPWTQNGRPPG